MKKLVLFATFIAQLAHPTITKVRILKNKESGQIIHLLGDRHVDNNYSTSQREHLFTHLSKINKNTALLPQRSWLKILIPARFHTHLHKDTFQKDQPLVQMIACSAD